MGTDDHQCWIIRSGGPGDRDGLTAVRRDAVFAQCREHYSEEQMTLWTTPSDKRRPGAPVPSPILYIAEIEGYPIGFGAIQADGTWIRSLYIRGQYAGCGLGRELMEIMLRVSAEKDVPEVRLESSMNAVPFYRRFGFEVEEETLYPLSDTVSLPCARMVKRLRDRRPGDPE